MFASKLCIILLVFNLFSNVLSAKKEFRIEFELSCGNIPVSGIVQFCNVDQRVYNTWNITRANKFQHKGKYEFYQGYYKLYIRSDCGILSPIGSYCQNEFEITLDGHGYQKTILWKSEPINLLKEIRKIEEKTKIMSKKCDEELKTFTCT